MWVDRGGIVSALTMRERFVEGEERVKLIKSMFVKCYESERKKMIKIK